MFTLFNLRYIKAAQERLAPYGGRNKCSLVNKQIKFQDLPFCQPAVLSCKELKVLKLRKKELEIFNKRILLAREQAKLLPANENSLNE